MNAGVLEPGWTQYRRTCLYSTYDLTSLLVPGCNRLTVLMGNGMYHVQGDRYMKFQDSYGDPVLWARLTLEYEDGHKEILETDKEWRAAYGPILHSCIYGGEDYDGRCTFWLAPVDSNREEWKEVLISQGPGGTLKPAEQPPVRVIQELPARLLKKTPQGALYDFGRNYAGVIRVRVKGRSGQKLTIWSGEILSPDQTINQQYSGGPYYNTYILGGNGTEEWMPRFSMYSQRYAWVETEAELLEVTGIERYADCFEHGSFECSNELYNAIHRLIQGAIRSNMQSVFTDCPHREKLGWLEELHLIGPGILYNYDARSLMEKSLQDMADAQTPEGLVPDIAPEYVEFGGGFRDSPEWGSSCVILLWLLYQRYGDPDVIRRHYDTADRYTRFLYGKSHGGYLEYGLGDWMDADHLPNNLSYRTPIGVTASMILYYDLSLMEKMAALVSREKDVAYYRNAAFIAYETIRARLYDPATGRYAKGSQTAQALAIFTGLVRNEELEAVAGVLKENIKKHDGHLTGGDVGYPFILRAMASCGMNDLIAASLNREEHPSYGYQVRCGATTLCEDWDGPTPGSEHNSQNHFMLGGAEEWFYGQLSGITISEDRKRVRFAPYYDPTVSWVRCRTGNYALEWKRDTEGIIVKMEVPEGVQVEMELGDAKGLLHVKKGFGQSDE